MYSNCFLPKQLPFTATPLTKEQIVNKWLSSQSQLKQQLWSRNNSITNTAPSSSCWGKFLLQRCGIVTQGYAMTSCYLAQWSLANYFCKVPGFVSSNALCELLGRHSQCHSTFPQEFYLLLFNAKHEWNTGIAYLDCNIWLPGSASQQLAWSTGGKRF